MDLQQCPAALQTTQLEACLQSLAEFLDCEPGGLLDGTSAPPVAPLPERRVPSGARHERRREVAPAQMSTEAPEPDVAKEGEARATAAATAPRTIAPAQTSMDTPVADAAKECETRAAAAAACEPKYQTHILQSSPVQKARRGRRATRTRRSSVLALTASENEEHGTQRNDEGKDGLSRHSVATAAPLGDAHSAPLAVAAALSHPAHDLSAGEPAETLLFVEADPRGSPTAAVASDDTTWILV